MQSTFHVAIVMDGNGRWARERGLPRAEGHRAGADSVKAAVEAAPSLGITDLTLYAFSSDNWKRPSGEVGLLMQLFDHYLLVEGERCRKEGVRLLVIGRRDRLAPSLVRQIEESEKETRDGDRLTLRIAVDYSSREALVRAAAEGPKSREELAEAIARANCAREVIPDVDLFIRTGREKRISDFLLWEVSYAELYFTDVMWPDFRRPHLAAAADEFHQRQRRFGAVVIETERLHEAI